MRFHMRRGVPVAVVTLLLAVSGHALAAAPTADEVEARAGALGVGDQAQRLRERFLPGARLVRGGGGSVGATRIGGRPDLPRGEGWPSCRGRPLSFLMQVDLAELAVALPGSTVARGTLFVFADLHERADGITQIELTGGRVRPGGCIAVRHSGASGSGLVRRAPPRRVRSLRAAPVRLRPTLTVPDVEMAEHFLGTPPSGLEFFDRWSPLYDETA